MQICLPGYWWIWDTWEFEVLRYPLLFFWWKQGDLSLPMNPGLGDGHWTNSIIFQVDECWRPVEASNAQSASQTHSLPTSFFIAPVPQQHSGHVICFSWLPMLNCVIRDDKQVVSIRAIGFAVVTLVGHIPLSLCEYQCYLKALGNWRLQPL